MFTIQSFKKRVVAVWNSSRERGEKYWSALSTWSSLHRKALSIGLSVFSVIAVGGWMLIPAPSASGAMRGATVDIVRNAEIRVYFSQRMNHGSVERAWMLNPSVLGQFRWEDNMVAFKPSQSLDKGQTYALTIGDGAKNIWGKGLRETYTQAFRVLDYPEAVVVVPEDRSEIRLSQRVTVMFDHPLRSLSTKMDVPAMLKMTPEVPGTYVWIGASGFEFTPNHEWPSATTFTVTIPKGTKTADGGETIEDKTWSFFTPRVQANFQQVYDGQRLSPTSTISLTTNYPIKDLQAVRDAFRATEIQSDGTSSTLSGSEFEFTQNPKSPEIITIRKKTNFQLSRQYQFTIVAPFTGGVGPNAMIQDAVSPLYTTDELGFRMVTVGDGETKEWHDNAQLSFNNPIRVLEGKDAMNPFVTITPAIKKMTVQVAPWGCAKGSVGNCLWIDGLWQPSTSYTIKVSGELADVYGQKLGSAQTWKVNVAEIRPQVKFMGYQDSGVFPAHLPRIYQLMAMNQDEPIHVDLYTMGIKDYLDSTRYDSKGSVSRSFVARTDFAMTEKRNHWQLFDMDLNVLNQKEAKPGIYQAEVLSHVWNRNLNNQAGGLEKTTTTRVMFVSDLAITLKSDAMNKAIAWVVDMKTGLPVPNVNVQFWTSSSVWQKAGSAQTNANGIATYTGDASQTASSFSAIVDGQGHFGITLNDWTDGISPYTYGLNYRTEPGNGHHIGYVYTDRMIYRPLQKVSFKGVVRKDLDAKLMVPSQKSIAVTVTDANGASVYTQDLPMSAFGTFNGEINIDPSMPLGTYTIRAQIGDGTPDWQSSIAGSFEVREYRRPDFRVSMTVPQNALSGQKAVASIHGEYFYGTPLSHARVHYDLTRNAYPFQVMRDEWYSFTEDDISWCYYSCPTNSDFQNVASGDAELDDQGNFSLDVPTDLSSSKSSVTYSLTVTVSDENQRQASANDSFVVHKGDTYVGIRPNYTNGWDSPSADFDLASVTYLGETRPNVPVRIQLFKRTWTNEQTTDPSGETVWSSKSTETLVESKSITTDEKGLGMVRFTPKEDGEYVARTEAVDTRGVAIKSAATRWLWRGDSASVKVTDDAHMEIKQNSASYEPGQTAELAVLTPFLNTKALVTIERQGIRQAYVMDLSKANRIVKVPITDDMVPNVFVSVTVIQGGGNTSAPQYRMGYARLQVSTKKKELSYAISADRKEYAPGDQVTLTVHAQDSEGKPAQVEASIAVVDEKIVALMGSIDKDIFGKFWFPRAMSVWTSETLTQMLKKVWTPEDTIGGGGGKGDNKSAVRGNFLDTAYWNATAQTDANGNATVTFKLPDNLTSWQILSIATTKDTRVGSAETTIITKKKLMIEPVLPRMLRHGDTATVGAMLVNATDKSQRVTVKMQAKGVTVDGATTRQGLVGAGQRLAMSWNVHVPADGDSASFTVTADGADVSDGFESAIPLLGYEVAEIDATSGILRQSASQDIELPDGAMPNKGEVGVTITPNSSYSITSAVKFLLDYQYGCSEQTASAVKGADQYLQLVKAKLIDADPVLVKKAEAKITDGTAKLLAMQQVDGGWGWWPEKEKWPSNPWNTGYVVRVLAQLKTDGYAVPSEAITKGTGYLRGVLEGRQYVDYWANTVHGRLAIASILAQVDPASLRSVLDSIYDSRQELSSYERIDLADAYGRVDKVGTSARRNELLLDVKNRMTIIDPTRAYIGSSLGDGQYNANDVYTTAKYLSYLLVNNSSDAQVFSLLRYTLESRKDHGWESTYAVSQILDALIAYTKAFPLDVAKQQVNIALDTDAPVSMMFETGDKSAPQSVVYPMSKVQDMGKRHQVTMEKGNDRPYFWDMSLNVYREITKVPAYENGFAISANITSLKDVKEFTPLLETKNGSIVRVHLKVIVPKERNNVALEYHLPAGLEAIDFSLRTSPMAFENQQVSNQCVPGWSGDLECFSESSWEWRWWWENVWKHIEMRDDRVFLFAERLEPGVYDYSFLVQAVTPGKFRLPPARVYEMYNPQSNAHNEGQLFRVNP